MQEYVEMSDNSCCLQFESGRGSCNQDIGSNADLVLSGTMVPFFLVNAAYQPGKESLKMPHMSCGKETCGTCLGRWMILHSIC